MSDNVRPLVQLLSPSRGVPLPARANKHQWGYGIPLMYPNLINTSHMVILHPHSRWVHDCRYFDTPGTATLTVSAAPFLRQPSFRTLLRYKRCKHRKAAETWSTIRSVRSQASGRPQAVLQSNLVLHRRGRLPWCSRCLACHCGNVQTTQLSHTFCQGELC